MPEIGRWDLIRRLKDESKFQQNRLKGFRETVMNM
jgi:hypothetical protein